MSSTRLAVSATGRHPDNDHPFIVWRFDAGVAKCGGFARKWRTATVLACLRSSARSEPQLLVSPWPPHAAIDDCALRREADRLWAALGDPTRIRLLDLLLERGEATASTLASALPITRQGVSKHLAILERDGRTTSAL